MFKPNQTPMNITPSDYRKIAQAIGRAKYNALYGEESSLACVLELQDDLSLLFGNKDKTFEWETFRKHSRLQTISEVQKREEKTNARMKQ